MTDAPVRPRRSRRHGGRVVPALALGAVLAVMAPVAALAASSSPAPTSSAATASASTLTIGVKQDVDSLNPFVGYLVSSYEIFQSVYDTLTGYSANNYSPTPGLASSWSHSADGLTWTFKIRSGVKWSDGVPLTAHDVAYTFNRIMHGSAEKTNYGNYVADFKTVTAPNDTTVVVTTKKPDPSMLALQVYILPEHIWKNVSEKQVNTFTNTQMVGSGPFIMDKRVTGQFVRMKANPNYWGGAPHVSEIVFRVFNNEDAMVQALRKGDIDFADDVQADLYKSLSNDSDIKLVSGVYPGFDEIGMNTGAATTTGQPIGDGNPALKDFRVRQAINYAINRQVLVSRVLGGYGSVGTSIIPPNYSAEHYTPTTDAYSYDPAKANQILDAAGYKKDSHGIRVDPKTGKEVSLRLAARSDSQTSQQTVQFVQSWIKAIGFKVSATVMSENALGQAIGDGDYDLFEWGWVVEPDQNYQLSTMTCAQRSAKTGKSYTAGLSDSFYCNPAYDAMYNKQLTQIDPAQRDATVKAAQKLLYDQAPYAITYYYNDLEAYRTDRFTGWVPQPAGDGALAFYYGVWSYRNIRPVSDTTAAGDPVSSSSSSNSATVIVLVVVVVVVVLGGGFVAFRRRSTADDRE
jgi:peptide/nickel transport system substrate-binding protein